MADEPVPSRLIKQLRSIVSGQWIRQGRGTLTRILLEFAVKLEYETLAEFMKRIYFILLLPCSHVETRDAMVLPWK